MKIAWRLFKHFCQKQHFILLCNTCMYYTDFNYDFRLNGNDIEHHTHLLEQHLPQEFREE